jgi:hypothetical protein
VYTQGVGTRPFNEIISSTFCIRLQLFLTKSGHCEKTLLRETRTLLFSLALVANACPSHLKKSRHPSALESCQAISHVLAKSRHTACLQNLVVAQRRKQCSILRAKLGMGRSFVLFTISSGIMLHALQSKNGTRDSKGA